MLANLVEGFELRRTSWLRWARLHDMDLLRAASAADDGTSSPTKPETVDFGWGEELLANIAAFAEAYGNEGSRVRALAPHTGWDDLKAEKALRVHHELLAEVQVVSQADYDEFAAEVGRQF